MSQPKCLITYAEGILPREFQRIVEDYAKRIDKRRKPFNCKIIKQPFRFWCQDIDTLPF